MSTIFSNVAAAGSTSLAALNPGRTTQTATAGLLSSGGNVNAAATTSGSTSGSSTSSTTSVSSSDFLTLLVSELQNQDPTQPTDPNTYVQQLVSVNSLQQLIQINQDLSGNGSSTTTGAVAQKSAAGI